MTSAQKNINSVYSLLLTFEILENWLKLIVRFCFNTHFHSADAVVVSFPPTFPIIVSCHLSVDSKQLVLLLSIDKCLS